jgi:GR25 family glycosyltransferase involved in LPS biosynthesis
MKLNKYLSNVKTSVINLKERNDKREWIKKQLRSENIEYNFYIVNKHVNPKRGCLESHLNLIKDTIVENQKLDEKNKIKYLFIMEDDCKFINSIKDLKGILKQITEC